MSNDSISKRDFFGLDPCLFNDDLSSNQLDSCHDLKANNRFRINSNHAIVGLQTSPSACWPSLDNLYNCKTIEIVSQLGTNPKQALLYLDHKLCSLSRCKIGSMCIKRGSKCFENMGQHQFFSLMLVGGTEFFFTRSSIFSNAT